jgi:hypothetical protein
MVSINASTTHTIKKKVTLNTGLKTTVAPPNGTPAVGKVSKGKGTAKTGRRGSALPLKPKSFNSPESIESMNGLSDSELSQTVYDLVRQILGGSPSPFGTEGGIAAPRAASTSTDRSQAAADLAIIVREKGPIKILKQMGVLEKIELNLIPNGIGSVFGNEKGMNPGGGMRKISSSVSLASMGSFGDDNLDTASTVVSDSKRGKVVPPEAREGCLLFIRALVEIVNKACEPFVVPLFAATLEECSSSSIFVREAAEDAAESIVGFVNSLAVPLLICPIIFEALHSPEWRVKTSSMERLSQCAGLHARHISRLLPEIVPVITSQVWDTKPQVVKAAKEALLACCQTNINPDVAPAVPAVVEAICKPAETSKAIDELKATTFVATVDASTLSILCPVLSRGLKDKMALNKRSCCIVIENMSRLVETPDAVAPFGPLLVPELKKVSENVQFEEIRDAALAALQALTKALGHASIDEAVSALMREETERIEAEQKRIEEEREAERVREEEMLKKEEEERKLWKEAMEAQRLLNDLAIKEEEEKKKEAFRKKEMAMTSTKGKGGKCQGCGLKKCKKTCLFFNK